MKTPILIVLFALFCFEQGHSISKNSDLTRLLTSKDFSGSALIAKNDRIIYHKSFGFANHQFDIPNTNETRYPIASITKLFTSTLIFQLYEIGKIDLNEPIKTYLPEYRGEGAATVTIAQLLTHTSGIKNCEEIGADVEILRMPNSIDDIIEKYCSSELVFQPGTRFSYNNADYIILGKIIERLYDESFEQILSEKILQPLKMANTGLIAQDDFVIKNLANAYLWDKNSKDYRNNPPLILGNYFSSGAMYSTARDLQKFSNSLFRGKLLSQKTLDIMLQTSSASPYWAHGLEILSLKIKDNELKSAYRQGGCQGMNTSLNYFFAENLTIVILANTNNVRSEEFKALNKAIAEIIIK